MSKSRLVTIRASDIPLRKYAAARLGKGVWGAWSLDKDRLVLNFIKKREGRLRYLYEIDIDKIGTAAEMLDWIMQIKGKSWATPKDIGNLVQALDDIFQPQAHLCSFGKAKTITNIHHFLVEVRGIRD